MLIPPLLALTVAIVWNVRQSAAISAAERDADGLKAKISSVATVRETTDRKASISANAGSVDLRQIAAALAAMDEGGAKAEVRAAVDFQQRVAGMSKDELLATLDELDRLGLSASERSELETLLLERLADLDPAAALERFASRAGDDDDDAGWELAGALEKWAKTDLAAATRWLDARIAAGGFASKSLNDRNETRGLFEAALMGNLISTDPQAAAARLQALPEDQRREVLEQLPFAELSRADQLAYAEMIRMLVPTDERAGSFANIAGQLVDDRGFGKVTEFLDAVHATPDERAAAARQTAESVMENLNDGVTRAEVDRLRSWLDVQAPGKTDAITGRALAEAAQGGGDFGFKQASQLVLGYQAAGGGDDILVAFLEGYSAHSNLGEARELAGKISDEKRRAEILAELE